MMMLSAVLLLIGFVALAGMVSRVSQLGTQTTTESRRSVLTEAGPLQDALDTTLSTLARRNATVTVTVSNGIVTATVTSPANPPGFFASSDVGLSIVQCTTASPLTGCPKTGALVPVGTTITAVASPTVATLSAGSAGTGLIVKVSKAGFSLDAGTTPSAGQATVSALEQLRRDEAEKGLLMGYDLLTGYYNAAGTLVSDCGHAQVLVRLSDGEVKTELRSSVLIPRSAGCADVQVSFFSFP